MTGETGAENPSLSTRSMRFSGERTSKEMIRSGENSAHVSAMFQDINEVALEKLQEMGYETEKWLPVDFKEPFV